MFRLVYLEVGFDVVVWVLVMGCFGSVTLRVGCCCVVGLTWCVAFVVWGY